ncbi:glycerate kinase [Parageobacillus thermoglucosidasius]|uniref:glycerate kinase n=1 Tax=Parageobacillus thermoglucosidasius TaxID=1426 RepID=UPI000E1A5576|nr:glycerate kinase [Parageobacillus thermoglucosidasius]MED4906246.1 glycerate kinase [Parageobacillus thermoglucosidasius]MED4915473.1 glycerate kinase [Parageobacillus thermoglucosidasius]MED4945851.1 glycerate kinase [Parageobacillus thermoglucosidasius]MED4984330.1 glycerate kinase [Parageobacillus thermoglucosidasius]RDE28642.1 glycerate kinase [Parageobacillus thermoglucosidasius]
MNIVVAPDSFKGSLTSPQAANIVKQAILDLHYGDTVITKPMADGGEGTVDALLASSTGDRIEVTCTGPLGSKIKTYYAILQNNTAVIEVANIAGLVQVPPSQRNPDVTTTFGLGEVMKDALDKGCKSFIIGLGGSATNDGGLGFLQALGMKAWDKEGKEAGIFGKDLLEVNQVSFDRLDPRLKHITIKVACDVDNPLCGEKGASAVYGPQKGASSKQIPIYDEALARFAALIEKQQGKALHNVKGAGAAGGLGFAFLALGAKLISGAELVAEASNLKEAIKQADLVITGEGQSDEQTLYGKAPGYIADLAQTYGVPTILISGSLAGNLDVLRSKFHGCFSIITQPLTMEECMDQAKTLLYNQTKQVMHLIHSLK